MKTITFDDLKTLLKARVTLAPSLRACARDLDVSPAYLSKILITKKAKIGPRVVAALGYRAITLYEKVVKPPVRRSTTRKRK